VVSVLVDNCIDSYSDTMTSVSKEFKVDIGGVQQAFRVLGFGRWTSPRPEHEWMRAEFECLPTVARVAHEERVQFCTYSELENEAMKRPQGFPATLVGDLFRGIKFRRIDAAIERSCFFQMEMSKFLSPEQMIKFCTWLLECDSRSPRLDALESSGHVPPFYIGNLRKVERYRSLCSGLSERQYADAFHLWTAEVNGLDYFLTMDRKFIRAMTESSRLSLPCKPIPPSVLLDVLGVRDRDPFPHPENLTMDIFGNRL